jgi:hypothetical protein
MSPGRRIANVASTEIISAKPRNLLLRTWQNRSSSGILEGQIGSKTFLHNYAENEILPTANLG